MTCQRLGRPWMVVLVVGGSYEQIVLLDSGSAGTNERGSVNLNLPTSRRWAKEMSMHSRKIAIRVGRCHSGSLG